MALPVNIDSTYADDGADASVQLHQAHHDALHARYNAGLQVVDAGTNLSTARPADAAAVLWRFDTGVDVGTEGANVVNGQVGDLYFVASA